ncbi:hypothetical protein F5X96DRAFT_285438 [Biscogniauxia mediterranea]|nr:hypothetical protein F5X96DRAFT_285438 [Biscogniauxia mediterranea]
MGVAYGEVAQSDNDDDRNDGPSPSLSLSPAPSSSPMPFLRNTGSTFTPLSMDSESYPGLGEGENDVLVNPSDSVAGTGTATAKARFNIGNMVQSLSPARATHLIKRSNQSDYDLLSPGDDPSSTSSSPAPDNTRPRLSQAQAQAQAQTLQTLESDPEAQRNFASNTTDHEGPKPTASHLPRPGVQPEDSPHQSAVPQPLVVVKPKPIVRTASTSSVSLRHPAPDLPTRSSSRASNIAQLEATAEQLSLTSSIEDAIRDLHEEQKRNDSRRSSILAAAIGPIPETDEPVSFPITRQISATSSILDTNSAARLGGYSPAGYVLSPNHSLRSTPSRLRSGSFGLSKAESDIDNFISRHGPGKSSVRSVRSASKPTLMNIDEMEPTTLTPAAMDEADKLAEKPEEDDMLQIPQLEDVDLTPNADQSHYMAQANDYWNQAVADSHQGQNYGNDRSNSPAGSDGTFEQAEKAFANFDGSHCSPDVDFDDSINFSSIFASTHHDPEEPFWPSFNQDPPPGEQPPDPSRPVISRPIGPPTVRPTSYLDPETGKNMLFYPARVPMMLNLPQKLSKKPKAETRNNRRSQVLNTLPEANRPSRASWLPEFVPEPLMNPLGSLAGSSTTGPAAADTALQNPPSDEGQNEPTPRNEEARKSHVEPDKRKSRLAGLKGLPPQLRASAFFDLPSESPAIQLKDGSAMATLDSILDASAKAPVSAFTDHSFAGTLGSEIYGAGNKRKSHLKTPSASNLVEPKKRSSFLHLRKPSALSRTSNSQDERRNTITGAATSEHGGEGNEEGQHSSGSAEGEPSAEEEVEGEEEPVYTGPPTTLLAELQIRKQQQKLRTRPVATAYPNGMHSTLLEMDTVAEIERKARKGKRVNLAWEGPSTNPGDESDDEDTPLGLLLAVKGPANGLVSLADLNRPPGLMERRDMEDNEPLSVRRSRLQGRETGPIKRLTMAQGLHMSGAMGPQVRVQMPEDDDEVEGETLGERMRRLRAQEDGDNPLPRARPVSSSFSAEMLTQLGDAFKDEEADTKDNNKAKSQAGDEETLGQRRRRLQAEREAKEREAGGVLSVNNRPGDAPKLNTRHSLADILISRGSKTLLSDPRAEAKKAREEEAARYRRDQEQKIAALRSQLPTTLSSPNLTKSGGYLAGRYNDGTGGGIGQPRTSMATGGFPGDSGMTIPARNSMMGNAFAAGGAMSGYNMSAGLGNAYVAPMQVQPAGQMDRVERWRQSVFP